MEEVCLKLVLVVPHQNMSNNLLKRDISDGIPLGEFMAVSVSLEHLSRTSDNKKASILSSTLDFAVEKLLKSQKSPVEKR